MWMRSRRFWSRTGEIGDKVCFIPAAYEVAFGPVKHGGRNFIQIAKITFEVGASSN